jgi:hypothetical protein
MVTLTRAGGGGVPNKNEVNSGKNLETASTDDS